MVLLQLPPAQVTADPIFGSASSSSSPPFGSGEQPLNNDSVLLYFCKEILLKVNYKHTILLGPSTSSTHRNVPLFNINFLINKRAFARQR